MSTNVSNITTSGYVLVPVATQPGGTVSVTSGSDPGTSPGNKLLKFKRRSPQVLGTVQIMVGLMLFLFGVMLCFLGETITVFSGVFVWAPICYIIAGSLTVAADRTMNLCLINGSMGMSIVAAVMSGIGTILYGLDAAGITLPYRMEYVYFYRTLSMGVSGVQCVFSLLVFIISICVSAFGCKATCCQQIPIMQAVFVGNNEGMVTSLATPSPDAPPSYSVVDHAMASDVGSSHGSGKQ